MRSILVFFCFAFPTLGASCPEFLQALGRFPGAGPFAIAVDYDGTMVETDSWLIDVVFPKAIERILDEVPWDRHRGFTEWLEHLKACGPSILPDYDEAAWARDGLFPAKDLPGFLMGRISSRQGASKVLGFWDLVQEIFEKQSGRGTEFVPEFLKFFESVNQVFGSEAHWVVVTARSGVALDDVGLSWERLGASNAVTILSGNPDFTLYPNQSAQLKSEQIVRFQSVSGLEVCALVDNDIRVLRAAKRKATNSLLLLHMLPKGRASQRLVQVPSG